MKKITYKQVINNVLIHLNKNYTEDQLGFTKKIHLNEEITALFSGLVDSINECVEDENKYKYAIIADPDFSKHLISGEAACECEGLFNEIERRNIGGVESRLYKCQNCKNAYRVLKI